MADGAPPAAQRIWARLLADRAGTLLAVLVLVLAGYVLVYPLSLVRYPPIIDLPFHAAQTSVIAHYGDPDWHFREQFTLHPIQMPYVTMYGLGAIVTMVAPPHIAAKVMVLAMLALLPLGLGILSWGLRKSPFLGALALPLCWNTLTYWGFLNFLGAIGLMAAALGFAFRLVDRPSRTASVGLGVALVLVFFTHVYRVPFAILSVIGVGVLMQPLTRRGRALAVPLAPLLLLFVVWLFVRDTGLLGGSLELGFDPSRLDEFPRHVFGAYAPPEPAEPTPLSERERVLSLQALASVLLAAGVSVLARRMRREGVDGDVPPSGDARFSRRAHAVVGLVVLGLLVTYLVLPLKIGEWFYVYPREAVSVVYFALALVPDLPKHPSWRASALALVALGAVRMTQFVATEFLRFEELTADFRAIEQFIPRAPKLFYLVYERRGTLRRVSPFLHLPAWIQAERGGWLNFHFVQWNHSVVRYREDGDAVPPPLPNRFEWTPQHFRMKQHGRWFDTFLVRHRIDPSALFESDPTVHLAHHEGMWWLYRRQQPASARVEPGGGGH